MKTLLNIILIFLISTNVYSDGIIDAKSAAKLIRRSDTQLISVRKAEDFQKVHIVGAIHMDHNDLYNEGAILKDAAELETILSGLGVNSSKHIILYDNGSMKYSGRTYWIFKYLGVENVSIIDGGMPEWRASRLPVTKNATRVSKGNFTANIQSKYFADKAEVSSSLKSSNAIVVDARSVEEFAEAHISGAINIPHPEMLNANGTMKSTEQLKSIFESNGVTPSKKVIIYCRTSVRAGVLFAALSSELGYQNVKVYDGAFVEWSGQL